LYIPECLYLEKPKASIPEWKNPYRYEETEIRTLRPKSSGFPHVRNSNVKFCYSLSDYNTV